MRFVSPQDFDRLFTDSALEVVLVNARSEIPPEDAQAVAQASLAGGGEARLAGAAATNNPFADEQGTHFSIPSFQSWSVRSIFPVAASFFSCSLVNGPCFFPPFPTYH